MPVELAAIALMTRRTGVPPVHLAWRDRRDACPTGGLRFKYRGDRALIQSHWLVPNCNRLLRGF